MLMAMTGSRKQVQHDNIQKNKELFLALLYQLKIDLNDWSNHDLKSMKPQTKTKTTGAMM